jgi:23S rRNA pseudouridine1911/1915/1917 synthase
MDGDELVVEPEAVGERLDVFLARAAGSRAAAQRLIAAGRVLVDGEPRAKRHTVAAGERVTIAPADEAPAPEVPDAPYAVAYEDEHLLVIDKPAGVVVHPARGHAAGLLVVARTEPAHAALKEQLRRREITREYLALVEGRPAARAGTIDAPLGRDRRIRTRVSTDTDEPRTAVTHFEVEQPLTGFTLLRVRLETGRTHQIRAHLLAIGHPVAGDREYGRSGLLGLERQFLHAERLAFRHPVTGEPVDVRSPLPGDLRAALGRLDRQ